MAVRKKNNGNKRPQLSWRTVTRGVLQDGLYVNSIWIVVNSIGLSGFGFLFWVINARLFSSGQLGLASTLISSGELLLTLSLLGFDLALIRYLPNNTDKHKIINSCFTLAGLFAIVTSLVFVGFARFFVEDLSVLWNVLWGIIFVIFVVSYMFLRLQSSVLIAQKRSKYVFLKTLIFSVLKVSLPFVLVFLGALGIISSWAIGAIASLIGGFLFIKMLPRLRISIPIIKKMFSFSAVNYICTFLALAPESILPLLITGKLNTSSTAYYYIAWNITAILFIVPNAISRTLLAENARLLTINLKKAIKFTATLLIPAVIIVVFISKYLLLLFGTEYSTHAHRLLQLLAISSIPFAINTIYICVQNVKHNLRAVFTVNIILASSTIGLSYLLLERGILFAGISWLISHGVIACVVLINSLVKKSEHKI